ncbi:MAG: TetR/AcrR family transcriptional regulator [Eubacteriales bacterium]|nr:TetR/AcrR family transcriptional regulator [Eubacteriales bacterium]
MDGKKNRIKANRKGEASRRRIRESACALFAQKGFKEVTMKDICEATGLSRGGLYCHYESTGQIFREIVGELMREQDDTVRLRMERGESAAKIAESLLEKYEREMCDGGASLSVAIYEYFSQPEYVSDSPLEKEYRRSAELWRELIRYGRERGEFREADGAVVADLLIFAYQGVRMAGKLMAIEPGIPARVVGGIRAMIFPQTSDLQPEQPFCGCESDE